MIIHNIEQGTDEWLKLKLGKLSGSDFHILFGNSQTKKTLLLKKACERLTNKKSDSDSFSSVHTSRGHELENEARLAYELLTDNEVIEVGFIEENQFLGCSPDGLVGESGMIEIKCKDNHTHLNSVLKQYIDPTHRTQMQFNLYVSGRKWCDYILYNPNFDTPINIIRVIKDEEYINKIKATIKECEEIINNHIQDYSKIK